MKLQILILSLITLLFTACSIKPLEPVKFETTKKDISFTYDIKPILDNRCVSCHSCYNSPCQLKLSSFEGLQRGASKEDVYANRLNAANPTRLFTDALNEKQWREKGFFSVTDTLVNSLDNSKESIMMQYLFQKDKNPLNIGDYSPETDELSCSKDQDELSEFFDDNPHKGMPYGFPALEKKEYNLLMTWLKNGAIDDTVRNNIPNEEQLQINKFESFLNNTSIKHQVSARYIYEHLFLAHISFDDKSRNFYELVRSKTPKGKEIEIIGTKFPYDEIKEDFFYRFRKIESTIVHKTHMVYKLNDKKLQRFKELFIEPTWEDKPYLASYDKSIAANALKVFEQIPAKSRYEFMLDDIHYIIMTFIRGPVCKGQIALNVIQDHFWVMFMDPKYDVSLHDKFYLHDNIDNLFIPNQYGDNPSILKTTSILENYELAKKYKRNKSKIYKQYYPNGLDINSIWKGNKDNIENDSILTIYRHFDSASVHKGALGNIPKTLWVIDYPLLERIYYSLVAGFDIFGNTPHQLLVRKHMDRLRIEGESNFLSYLPKESREDYFSSWYKGWLASQLSVYVPSDVQSAINYKTNDFKEEFIQKTFEYLDIKKDSINFIEKNYITSEIKEKYQNKEEIEETFKSLTLPNSSELIKTFSDSKSNLAHIRIKMNNEKSLVYSMIINRWHENVSLLFSEESRLDSTKDTVNYIEGFKGSYPNVYVEVKQDDLNEFFNLLKNYKDTDINKKKILKFVINRANPNFWKSFDWFNSEFKRKDSLNYGLMDLNRYISKAIN
jgi:hypothetical protein